MAFAMAVGDVFEARMYATNDRQLSINTIHLKILTVIVGTATLQDVADAIARKLTPDFIALIDENATVEGWKVRRVTPTKTKAVSTFVGSGAGTVTGDLLPGQVSGMLQLNTDDPGPGTDGRLYLPFPSEGDSEGQGTPTNGYLTRGNALGSLIVNAQTYVSDAMANLFTARGVVLHRATGGSSEFTGAVTKQGWATRHSRGGLTKGDQPFS